MKKTPLVLRMNFDIVRGSCGQDIEHTDQEDGESTMAKGNNAQKNDKKNKKPKQEKKDTKK